MPAKFTLKGSKAMQRKIDRISRTVYNKVEAALRIEAELIMTDSKKNYVPVDLGTLRSSGFVNPVERTGLDSREVQVTLGFGGAAEAYAIAVHEHPSGHSPPSWINVRDEKGRFRKVKFSPKGRGPKYLEKPLMSAIPGMATRIASRLNIGRV